MPDFSEKDYLLSEDFVIQESIPILSNKEEEEFQKKKVPSELSILTLRNTVLYPGTLAPITVGRDKSIKLIQENEKGMIGVFTQKDAKTESPEFDDIFTVGTMAKIVKQFKLPDGNVTIIIQGLRKIEIAEKITNIPYLKAKVTGLNDIKNEDLDKNRFKVLMEEIKSTAIEIIELSPNIPSEAAQPIRKMDNNRFLIHMIAMNVNGTIKEKQDLLETFSLQLRAEKLLNILKKEMQLLEIKDEIHSKVKGDLDQQQREYFLNQQIKAIQEELGGETADQEVQSLREKGKKKKWTKEVGEKFNKELDKLGRINPASPEYGVTINYAQLLLELPWGEYTDTKIDLKKAKEILDEDHYGMEKVKRRILEYLAVLKIKNDMKSPIICLYGPPGVGKTSLGKSIARAIGRKYVRMALGGIHDESEIRGHRKTYIGAMPGRVIQNLKKVKSSNPVFVLDEVDKITRTQMGDPSSALLEVLDPEQNANFYDNYLEIEYDLSKILFIATANSLDSIQPALRDRMEIIEINGYTVEEKIEIAKRHLLAKQREAHGLNDKQLIISDSILEKIVEEYTYESGVRSLDKKIASIARWVSMKVASNENNIVEISANNVEEILGPDKMEKENYEDNSLAGVVPGLAWSPSGGSILYVESAIMQGKGKLTLTGKLGEVMKESAMNALSFIKANAKGLNIKQTVFDKWDLHIHFPAGAIPKDGPSAGIAILTAITSQFTQRKIKKEIALTGEITLRGKVLPVGGIKEKILAARRAGIKTVVMCHANKKDVDDIPKNYLGELSFHYVKTMQEVLDFVLLDEKVDGAVEL